MENNIDLIPFSPSSFGNFNAVLSFSMSATDFPAIYEDLLDTFKPIDVKKSFFDLDKEEMKIADSIDVVGKPNCILRIILHRDEEDIILEYFDSKCLIQNLFHPQQQRDRIGDKLIKKYLKKKGDSILVLGFELSMDIQSFKASLNDTTSDPSCHPIVIIKSPKGKRHEKDEYVSDSSEISRKKMEMILEYTRKVNE